MVSVMSNSIFSPLLFPSHTTWSTSEDGSPRMHIYIPAHVRTIKCVSAHTMCCSAAKIRGLVNLLHEQSRVPDWRLKSRVLWNVFKSEKPKLWALTEACSSSALTSAYSLGVPSSKWWCISRLLSESVKCHLGKMVTHFFQHEGTLTYILTM